MDQQSIALTTRPPRQGCSTSPQIIDLFLVFSILGLSAINLSWWYYIGEISFKVDQKSCCKYQFCCNFFLMCERVHTEMIKYAIGGQIQSKTYFSLPAQYQVTYLGSISFQCMTPLDRKRWFDCPYIRVSMSSCSSLVEMYIKCL